MGSPIFFNDSIVAIATAPGEGGIGVLRLSGPQAPKALTLLWQGKLSVEVMTSHRLYLGKIIHPQTKECLDEALVVRMRAPRSYTGEEVVEIHSHGGPLLLNQILNLLLESGLRLAEPGEFTRRAYLNGKLDLLQAEAVSELIAAKSEAALHNARSQLEGKLSSQIAPLREALLKLLSRVEAAIDFPEEDIEILQIAQTLAEIESIDKTLQGWEEKFNLGRLAREGIKIALIGRPNVGKSSLLNRLLDEDRAIVHESPGTTRDIVEGWAHWGGYSFQLFDTAGIREGEEEIEREGIRRSKKIAMQADIILCLIDASSELKKDDRSILETLDGRVLPVANKIDLGIKTRNFPKSWQLFPEILRKEWVFVSAYSGEGIGELREKILQELGLKAAERSEAFLNNARHHQALLGARRALKRAIEALIKKLPSECVAADLREAAEVLGGLLGQISSEEILDRIFSDFCIGK